MHVEIIIFFLLWLSFPDNAVSDLIEPCDARQNGCVARNKALPATVSVPMTKQDKLFEGSGACPEICYNSTGAQFQILKRFDNPMIHLDGYILHGSVEADILAANGQGVILSFYLQSDDKDEIDIAEIFGNNHLLFQTNYFSKGDVTTNGKGIYIGMQTSPLYNFHRYGVNWTTEEIVWTVDGVQVRRVQKLDLDGFPSSPMKIKFSMWVGGDPANEPGTVTWSGGLTDFKQAPFHMYVRNVSVINAGGGTEYTYLNTQLLEILGEQDVSSFNGLNTHLRTSLSTKSFSLSSWIFISLNLLMTCLLSS